MTKRSPGGDMKRPWLTRAGLATFLALILLIPAAAASAAPAGDGPPGFWWGTDSFPVSVPGSAPYRMPFLGGAYGGDIRGAGGRSDWPGCTGGFLAFSPLHAPPAPPHQPHAATAAAAGALRFTWRPRR